MIKNLLIEHISENVKDDIVAVLMSGGVDSLSVAFGPMTLVKEWLDILFV